MRLLYQNNKQQTIDDFILPFGGALAPDNRWVVKAEMIPWDDIEGDYSDLFPGHSAKVRCQSIIYFHPSYGTPYFKGYKGLP